MIDRQTGEEDLVYTHITEVLANSHVYHMGILRALSQNSLLLDGWKKKGKRCMLTRSSFRSSVRESFRQFVLSTLSRFHAQESDRSFFNHYAEVALAGASK